MWQQKLYNKKKNCQVQKAQKANSSDIPFSIRFVSNHSNTILSNRNQLQMFQKHLTDSYRHISIHYVLAPTSYTT